MKFTETDHQLLGQRLNYIGERWDQLNRLSKDAADRAIAHLMLTNAGGAVAMLSFLGTDKSMRGLLLPKLALGFFLLGIIFVGILDARILQHVEKIFRNWRNTVPKFYEDETEWEDMIASDNRLSYAVQLEYLFGYTAFFCFIAGAAIGIYGLLWS
jgi:hypothetical protein